MSWSNLPATAATDWSQVDFLNQFVYAVFERHMAYIGDTSIGLGLFEVGDDVQLLTAIKTVQEKAVQVGQYFTDPSTMSVTPGAVPASFGTVGSTAWKGSVYSAASLMDAAGLTDGFTRKVPRTIEDVGDAGTVGQRAYLNGGSTVYEHDGDDWLVAEDQVSGPDTVEADSAFPRYIEAGDYIGPWIWNDLRAVLDVPEVRIDELDDGDAGTPFLLTYAEPDQYEGGSGYEATSATAKANTEADWPGGSSVFNSPWPGKVSVIDFRTGSGYRAGAIANHGVFTAKNYAPAYSFTTLAELVCEVRPWGHFGETFNDFGVGLTEDKWCLFDSGAFDAADTLEMGGDLSFPAWEDDADGVEGWGWRTYDDFLNFRPYLIRRFVWDHS